MKTFDIVYMLYNLALLGAIDKYILINSIMFSKIIGCSQQTASRKLILLEKMGYISRIVDRRGQYIRITKRGLNILLRMYGELNKLFNRTKEYLILQGRVFTGLGEGAFYVTIPYYYRKFTELLGDKPYPGTLNLKLLPESIVVRKKIELMDGIEISGFSDEKRKYGSVKFYKVFVEKNIVGGLLLIERTHYGPDVIEIISPKNLRKTLNLKDGNIVTVKVFLKQVK